MSTEAISGAPAKPKTVRPKPAPRSARPSALRIVGTVLMWLFAAFNIMLLYWLVSASFKTPIEIFRDPFGLPRHWFNVGRPLRNYYYAWHTAGFGRAFLVTVVVVALASIVVVAISAVAAYALSRFGTRWASPMTSLFAMGIGIPFQTVIIPLFIVLGKVHLTNNLFGIFLLYVGLSIPFTVFLLTGFFAALPDELEEAAAIDGASPVRTFTAIMLPLARGGIITAFILTAIGLWNETLLAIVFLQDNANFTLGRALFSLYGAASYQSEYGGLIAGVAIVVLPMLVLYILLARRIITGLTLGAGK